MHATSTTTNNRLVLLAACLAAVLLPTSITGTAVTLPAIAQDIEGDIVQLQWVVHAYDLTFASFMLALGSLSDIYGRRRIFRIGMLTYAVCALLAALSQNLLFLDVVRGVTGIAAAAVMTSASAAIAQSFQGAAQAKAFGIFGTSFGIGLAFGPLIGGGTTTAFGWRFFFVTQLVVAICALACSHAMPRAVAHSRPRVDWGGAGLFVASLFLFILALVEAPQLGLADPLVVGSFAASVLLLGVFCVTESRSDHPMFDLSLLRQSRYMAICVAPVSLAFGFVALLVFLPTYFMTVHDMSPWRAGLFMLVLTLPTLYMPALAGTLVAKGVASPRTLMVLCMSLVGAGCLWLITVDHETSLLATSLPLFVIGTGFGISNGILDGAAATSVPAERAGMAVGMFNTMRIAGEVVAIAVVGALVVGYLRSGLAETEAAARLGSDVEPQGIANALAEGRLAEVLSGMEAVERSAFREWALTALDSAMHWSYLWVGLLCLATVPLLAAFMRRAAPSSASTESSEEPASEPVLS